MKPEASNLSAYFQRSVDRHGGGDKLTACNRE